MDVTRLISCIFALVTYVCAGHTFPVVKTKLGPLEGSRVQISGSFVDVFLRVPYARPPLGTRRFKRPEPVEPWTTTLRAVKNPKACAQAPLTEGVDAFSNEIFKWKIDEDEISEDCLYLNIYKPMNAKNAAVMVFIHGGGFSMGTINIQGYDGRYLSSQENVIVVTIQYRLAMFGFLYLGDDEAPGNMGLVDQHLAVKWVHDNIAEFGGDNDRITVFGESAGASSAQYHTLSNLPNYFKRVILESAPTTKLAFYPQEVALHVSKNIIQTLGCDTEDTPASEILSCLAQFNHTFISDVSVKQIAQPMPTLDNYFFEAHPDELYDNVADVDIIIGTTENEGFFLSPPGMKAILTGDTSEPSMDLEEYEEIIQKVTSLDDSELLNELNSLYKNADSDYIGILDGIFGDTLFTCFAIDAVEKYIQQGVDDIFMYRFTARSNGCAFPEWMKVSHGCDVDYVFAQPLGPSKLYKEKDRRFTKQVTKYWGNFAKTGNPNVGDEGETCENLPNWPRYTLETRLHQILGFPTPSTGANLNHDKCNFWARTQVIAQPIHFNEMREENKDQTEGETEAKEEL